MPRTGTKPASSWLGKPSRRCESFIAKTTFGPCGRKLQRALLGGLWRFREVGYGLDLRVLQPEVDEGVLFARRVLTTHGQGVLPVVVARHLQVERVVFRSQLFRAAILAADDV